MNKLIRLQQQRILNDTLPEKDYFLQHIFEWFMYSIFKTYTGWHFYCFPHITYCSPLKILTTTKLLQIQSSHSLTFA